MYVVRMSQWLRPYLARSFVIICVVAVVLESVLFVCAQSRVALSSNLGGHAGAL